MHIPYQVGCLWQVCEEPVGFVNRYALSGVICRKRMPQTWVALAICDLAHLAEEARAHFAVGPFVQGMPSHRFLSLCIGARTLDHDHHRLEAVSIETLSIYGRPL